jgi:hypothetical protein
MPPTTPSSSNPAATIMAISMTPKLGPAIARPL